LRAILEESMLNMMYELPSKKDLKEVVITEECIDQGADPIMVFKNPEEPKAAEPESLPAKAASSKKG
jgi:ATP-dependent Clp protease ATP-binding subunit ClpX